MRIVVVGAGIVGASVAHHLTGSGPAPRHEVIVVDQGHRGKATLAGAGIVCPWSSVMDDGPLFELYAEGAAAYEGLISEVAGRVGTTGAAVDLGYRRVGALVVSDDPTDLDRAEERLARRSIGRPEVGTVRRIANAEARSLFPPLRTGVEAVHIAGGARVDGRLLAEAMLAGSGAERIIAPARAELMVEGSQVTGVRLDAAADSDSDSDGGRGGVGSAGETIAADAVVVAAGAWTADVLEPLGLGAAIDIEPQKGQIIHFGLDVDTSRWPVVLPVGPHYLLAFDDSRVVVGATREVGSGFDIRVTASGQAEVLATALSVAPGLADATVLETRVGLRPYARGLPTIGAVPGVDGLFVGTGLGAAGLTIGPLWGRLLADLVAGRPATIDLAPFGPPG